MGPHLCRGLPRSARGRGPQGREQASAPSKAPTGMPTYGPGGAPCFHFFLTNYFQWTYVTLDTEKHHFATWASRTSEHTTGVLGVWTCAHTEQALLGGVSWGLLSIVTPTIVNILTL